MSPSQLSKQEQQQPIPRKRGPGRMKRSHLPMCKKCSPLNKTQDTLLSSPHLRCASHTLNLISTNDIEKWLTMTTNTGYNQTTQTTKTVYRRATVKCSALWTKASRSTVAAEIVEAYFALEMCTTVAINANFIFIYLFWGYYALTLSNNLPLHSVLLLFSTVYLSSTQCW